MSYAVIFFAGAFLCNCIPHLCAGLQGMPFPTPFAKPRGIGKSVRTPADGGASMPWIAALDHLVWVSGRAGEPLVKVKLDRVS